MQNLRKLAFSSFEEFKKYYHSTYDNAPLPHPAWEPTSQEIASTNLYKAMETQGHKTYSEFYYWSINQQEEFLKFTANLLKIKFDVPYSQIIGQKEIPEKVKWFPNAKLNIVNSCFTAEKNKTAIIFQDAEQTIQKISYGELDKFVNRIANSISSHFKKGDALAIIMPMNIEAVAIYLAIIKAGCIVVSIADSFAPEEIRVRLEISQTKAIFTQDYYLRNKKDIKIYEKVKIASNLKSIVFCLDKKTQLQNEDKALKNFISDNEHFDSISCKPDSITNILFSSGTTGTPKAIPWTHTTPIRSALDAFYHQDIQGQDIVAWPTNLGWMMGPWLVYACFINQATMALCNDAPNQSSFGKFIQDQKITILGLVPSIVTSWKASNIMEKFDWSAIKCFSSSGECSSPEDYLYLMWLGKCKPIIEYCGGTEIGGAYISSTLIQPNSPSMFTSPTLGMRFVLLDEEQKINQSIGEVALVPPALGLSQTLLNRDHHEVYFKGMPKINDIILRRHGDQIHKINDECYQALGRIDDTMNLGGIKISSAEIERVLNELEEALETAAIAVPPRNGGPSLLIIYAICSKPIDKKILLQKFQQEIKSKLNPLFKIHDVVIVDSLPRTASNKIMRRTLRNEYL